MTEEGPISRRELLLGGFLRRDPPAAEPDASSPATPVPPGVVHRPPGAVPEAAFLAGCTRCGDCITACPVDAITLAPDRFGPAAGTPMIDPAVSPCVMCADLPCIASCEPDVLSLDEPVAMGTAEIREAYCIAYAGTMCTVCSERCPVEGAITVDPRGRPVVNQTACTGCGVCQHVCPAPYNAVVILPRDRSDAGAPPAAPEASADGSDWRRSYLGDRSLKPPWGAPPT